MTVNSFNFGEKRIASGVAREIVLNIEFLLQKRSIFNPLPSKQVENKLNLYNFTTKNARSQMDVTSYALDIFRWYMMTIYNYEI